ncbi:MAG TPA: alpha/beta hydrolase-fold protein [Kofleriaceae bacterium]|nr:alpha/beta hydrolase-fold protein [Kofleriaceae bacterium]
MFAAEVASATPRFEIAFDAKASARPLDGRLLLIVSNDPSDEPRNQVGDTAKTQQIFGIDVDGWKPGDRQVIDAGVLGYPRDSLRDVPAGKFRVQAVLHRYETFHRKDGHTVKLPMDRGEGQQWNKAPGNLYSTPIEVTFDPAADTAIRIALDKAMPAVPQPKTTKYIRHERIQSKLLTEFWGRPMYLGAHILVPEGFDNHPRARYPLIVNHGHFPDDFGGFRDTPPDPNLKPDYNERFQWKGYNRTQQEEAYRFYKLWTGPSFPRVLIVEIQHANPFYDDSYAVDSANVGPYGAAIQTELIPYLEKKYRALGTGWSRFVYGGSTGGWEAMAVQTFYPDFYNGAYVACPDPIDFRAYTVIDLYKDTNAFYLDAFWKRTPRSSERDALGRTVTTVEESSRRELVLGTHGRSGDQWDIWQAVYSPVGPDGYPASIWDKRTGAIDRKVADYWKQNYDLMDILRRNWERGLGEKLRGKLHIYVGTMDTYFLDGSVHLAEQFLSATKNPPYEGEVTYGPGFEHCWNGDPKVPNALTRLRYHEMFVPRIVERIAKTAPPDADLTSWRY